MCSGFPLGVPESIASGLPSVPFSVLIHIFGTSRGWRDSLKAELAAAFSEKISIQVPRFRERKKKGRASDCSFLCCFQLLLLPPVCVITLQPGSRPGEPSVCQTVPSKRSCQVFPASWLSSHENPCYSRCVVWRKKKRRGTCDRLLICGESSPWMRGATYSADYDSN